MREKAEARVLSGLQERLVTSEVVAEAVQAFAKEVKRLNQTWRVQSAADRKALGKVERAIAGIMAAIEDGMYQSSMKARLASLEGQKADIVARLGGAPPDVPDVHPDIASHYRRNVERFTEALDDPDGGKEAVDALRSLIGGIVFTPGEKRGEVHITLRGELMGILDVANDVSSKKESQLMTAGEAGPRNHLNLRCQRITNPSPETGWGFRLSATRCHRQDAGQIATDVDLESLVGRRQDDRLDQ